MDKHTQSQLVWGFFVLACFLACWANCKAWINGEVTRSSRGFRSWTIKRDENPESFRRYMFGMFIINGIFFLVVVVWGIALFFR